MFSLRLSAALSMPHSHAMVSLLSASARLCFPAQFSAGCKFIFYIAAKCSFLLCFSRFFCAFIFPQAFFFFQILQPSSSFSQQPSASAAAAAWYFQIAAFSFQPIADSSPTLISAAIFSAVADFFASVTPPSSPPSALRFHWLSYATDDELTAFTPFYFISVGFQLIDIDDWPAASMNTSHFRRAGCIS